MMDIDPERLDLMRLACKPRRQRREIQIDWTTDAKQAIDGADFIVTTFRQGSRNRGSLMNRCLSNTVCWGRRPARLDSPWRCAPCRSFWIMSKDQAMGAECWLLNFTNPPVF